MIDMMEIDQDLAMEKEEETEEEEMTDEEVTGEVEMIAEVVEWAFAVILLPLAIANLEKDANFLMMLEAVEETAEAEEMVVEAEVVVQVTSLNKTLSQT